MLTKYVNTVCVFPTQQCGAYATDKENDVCVFYWAWDKGQNVVTDANYHLYLRAN